MMRLLTVLFVICTVTNVMAAQNPDQTGAYKFFEGQLSKVDPETKTISLADPEGMEVVFHYTEQTRVLSDNGMEGLSGGGDHRLRVLYADHAGKFIATQIMIINERP